MIGKQPPRRPRTRNLRLQRRIPPRVIHIHRYPHLHRRPQHITQIIRLTHRHHRTPVTRIHRMQWLNRQLHPSRTRMPQTLRNPLRNLLPTLLQRLPRHRPAHQYQHRRTTRRRLVNRPQVVLHRRPSPRHIHRRKKPAPRQPAALQPSLPHPPPHRRSRQSLEIPPPKRDPAHPGRRILVNTSLHRPRLRRDRMHRQSRNRFSHARRLLF